YIFSKLSVPAITAIRFLFKYFWRLRLVLTHIKNGKNEKEAIDSLSPPVFYKSIPNFVRNVKIWDIESVTKVLAILNDCELDCKSNYFQTELIFENAVLLILNLVKRKVNSN